MKVGDKITTFLGTGKIRSIDNKKEIVKVEYLNLLGKRITVPFNMKGKLKVSDYRRK